MTIHDASRLGNPDPLLARIYTSSLERNIAAAIEAKRFDHAETFATLHGLLADPPPPYSPHPPLDLKVDLFRDRDIWEQGIAKRKLLIEDM